MPNTNAFDKFFLNLPPLHRESDFNDFWKKSIKELKKIPIDPIFEQAPKTSKTFNIFNITFKGFRKSSIKGELYHPRNIDTPRVIILIPDYNRTYTRNEDDFDNNFAYFTLTLRGHEILNMDDEEGIKLPGYMVENIMDKDNYYASSVYLDAYRTIDMLRLYDKLDCSAIGLLGKGFGAAAALFTASFSERVKALVLDTPSFCYLDMCQNISKSDAAKEINEFLSNHRSKKNIIKKNLSYFDAINFSALIQCPTLTTVGFKDTISPPQCVFALFNHLLCDKTVEIYPEDGNEAGGGTQFKKSIRWLKEILLNS